MKELKVELTQVRDAWHHLQRPDVFPQATVVLFLGCQIIQLVKCGLVLAANQLRG